MKLKRGLLVLCTSTALIYPSIVNAKNNDVPFYDGKNDTFLSSKYLQLPGKYFRPGSGYAPKESLYRADIHFPAVYNGSFNWGNPKENLVQAEDSSEPYIRIANEGYLNGSVPAGDRMVTEVERVNKYVISDKYWGNPDFVLDNIDNHSINTYETYKELGQFYWIRDIAYLSGGYAGAGAVEGIKLPWCICCC
ncbi:hypothetical protein [Bacillus thuringiensis]|uniref:hypothetical protein n=1 Tax=Bacillus thuringiensis TaxID=1428 RepID=UPI003EC153E3